MTHGVRLVPRVMVDCVVSAPAVDQIHDVFKITNVSVQPTDMTNDQSVPAPLAKPLTSAALSVADAYSVGGKIIIG